MIRTAALAFFLFTSLCAFATKYPSYEEVLRHFYSNYSKKDLSQLEVLQFRKKPDGWHVAILDYSKDIVETKRQELLWSRLTLQYQKLSFPAKEGDDNNEYLKEALRSYDKELYAIYPYYGYADWSSDVIQELEGKENLSDTLLYALARSYSDHAGNLLHDYQNLGNKTSFNLPDGPNSMTPAQLETYRKYSHLAIRTFEKLRDQNPKFETIVGLIRVKCWNEYLTAFLDIWMYQDYEEALKELPDGLYNDFYIAVAKNYLETCAPNAILFTNGDNDTYPLLYAQAKLGIRRDVIVANLSLLQTSRYIEHLRGKIFDAPQLKMSLSPEVYRDKQRDVIYLSGSGADPMDLEKAMEYIADDKNKASELGAQNMIYLPQRNFTLTAANGKKLTWSYNRSYMLKNNLALLDMLATNKLQRPMYLVVTSIFDEFAGLNDYMWAEGLAYRLTTKKTESEGQADADVMYNNMMKKFDWKMSDSPLISDEARFANNYRIQWGTLASALVAGNKNDKARAALDKAISLFPDEKLPFDIYTFNFVHSYYALKDYQKGNAIALKMIRNLAPDLEKNNRNREVLENMKLLAETNGQKEVMKAIDKALKSR
jgi:hypothetical protein